MDYWSEWHMAAPVYINVISRDKSCHITDNVLQWRNTLKMSLLCILALVPKPEYSGITIWISGLHFVSHSRQQPWHWQRRTHESLSSTRKVFNDLRHLVVGTPWRSYDATVLAVAGWMELPSVQNCSIWHSVKVLPNLHFLLSSRNDLRLGWQL